ncbi:beta-1,3-galactosyltransferase 1 isoform X2 [Diachasma alloeum]|uniref:beta-1,3-galactosyltransferase 1 isoform X2 n=1 Tax=Diachasma alloeum TaxID=454923 RepID=UPI00073845FB|nr:beta-1,3-galactosyltransferase 1 isoform X2 [Diachasma alloeum]
MQNFQFKIHLLPMELPSAAVINSTHNARGKMSFIRRLGLGCIILAFLGLLYVPAYHSAQGPLGIGEATSSGPSRLSRYLEPVEELHGWSFNASRNLDWYIHPQNNTTILNPNDSCTVSTSPYLLIVVCSAVDHQKQRMAIRDTWASETDSYNSTTIKVVFLLGQSDNETLNNSIAEENHQYGDLIQEKFIDAYNNLTIKSVMLLKWVTTNCPQATYLMKTDDDMYINVDNLVKALKSRPQSVDTLIGALICNARPISDPKNKWYTPKYMFSEKIYPNYLSGTGYVMSLDVASKLYESALSTPLLHLEDVYITGLCARNAKLRPVDHPGFSYTQRKLDTCILRSVVTAHRVDTSTMHTIWNKLKNSNATCREKKATVEHRHGRNFGYFLVKKRATSNHCV